MTTALHRCTSRVVASTLCAGLIAIGLGLGGCVSSTYSQGSVSTGEPAASARQHPLLENIPLPAGFRMVVERSVARQDGRTRMALCEFEGARSPEQVTHFYQNYMPSANFTLKQSRLDGGQYRLRFESDTEECNIRVSRARSRTVLVVDLGPLPRGSAEREIKPPVRRP